MISLTRINHQPLFVNSDAIKFVENAPDTTLTLMNGEKLLVLETAEEIVTRIVTFRRRVLGGLALEALAENACANPAAEVGLAGQVGGSERG